MIIRRKNWPAFLAVAILGPLAGIVIANQFDGLSCEDFKPVEGTEKQTASAPAPKDETSRTTLQLPDGDSVAIDDIAPERAVAIVVMKAPWCPVCQRQLKRLSNRLEDIQSVNGTVVGLTTASADKNRALAERLGLGFPILGEPSKSLHKHLGLWRSGACHAIPGVIFLDESGEIVDIHRGRYPGQPQDEFIVDRLRDISG